MLSVILAMSAIVTSGLADSPNFGKYAEDFRDAILAKDEAKVTSLIGNRTLSDAENMRYAFDSDYVHSSGSTGVSIHETMSRKDLKIVIESSDVGGIWQATIIFVPSANLESAALPVMPQLGRLTPMKDYAVCQVLSDKGVIRMKDHFCFLETDALDN